MSKLHFEPIQFRSYEEEVRAQFVAVREAAVVVRYVFNVLRENGYNACADIVDSLDVRWCPTCQRWRVCLPPYCPDGHVVDRVCLTTESEKDLGKIRR